MCKTTILDQSTINKAAGHGEHLSLELEVSAGDPEVLVRFRISEVTPQSCLASDCAITVSSPLQSIKQKPVAFHRSLSVITEHLTQEKLMDQKQRIIELARQMGLIRPRDVEEVGIHREYLLRLYRDGDLTRVGRGLYALPDAQTSESLSLAEVAKRMPNAVICLISALEFHHLTTQIAHSVWIAIENKKWEPRFEYPPLEIVRFSTPAFSFGVEEHEVGLIPVKIYSPAKSVADCFKFRNKIGLDVAIEALRETWRSRQATMDELWEAAKVCRVANVMRPYLEAVI